MKISSLAFIMFTCQTSQISCFSTVGLGWTNITPLEKWKTPPANKFSHVKSRLIYYWLCIYLLLPATQNVSDLGLYLSRSLNVKCNDPIELLNDDFLLVFKSNIWLNSPPLWDITLTFQGHPRSKYYGAMRFPTIWFPTNRSPKVKILWCNAIPHYMVSYQCLIAA